jgi:hypothetical protein
MNKIIKRVILALSLALVVACLCSFAVACDNGDNGGSANSYTVTVVYPNGNPVNGTTDGTEGLTDSEVQVQWCIMLASGVQGDYCSKAIALGTDGKATQTLNELGTGEKYHVILRGLPTGYTYNEETYMSEPGSITITLVAAN